MEEVPNVDTLPRPPDEIRRLVDRSFVTASKFLKNRRANIILRNVLQYSGNDDTESPRNIETEIKIASQALCNINKCRASLDRADRAPNSMSWIRLCTNLKTPEAFKDKFFVPYIGETDAQQNFSNTLAADADTCLIENYVEDDISDVENTVRVTPVLHGSVDAGAQNTSPRPSRPASHSKANRQSSPRQRSAVSTKKTLQEHWARAAKRRALEDVMSKLCLTSTRSIAGVVVDIFGLQASSQVASCYKNVQYRRGMYRKKDKDAAVRKEHRARLFSHIHQEKSSAASVALRGDSIPFFFCRQCYLYNCLEHGSQTATPNVFPQDRSRKDSTTKQSSEEIESACTDKGIGRCWCASPSPLTGEIWWDITLRKKENADDVKSLLLESFVTVGKDPCRIVCILRKLLPKLSKTENLTCNNIGYLLDTLKEVTSAKTKVRPQTKRPGRRPAKKSYRTKAPRGETDSMNNGRRVDYAPCQHDGPCTAKSCRCVENGVNCEKFCACNHSRSQPGRADKRVVCRHAFQGCTCKSAEACISNACICFSYGRECDPDLCRACHDCKVGERERSCRNVGLLMGERQRTLVGRSSTHGWGAFAAMDISKGDIIGEYVGEIVSHLDADRRGRLYDEIDYSFLFNITENWALDSTRLGNKLRYCNHHFKPNCTAKLMRVGGDVRVGLYALRDICSNEELFFDYKYKNGPSWSMPGRDNKRPSSCVGREDGSAKKRAVLDEDGEDEVIPLPKRRRMQQPDHSISPRMESGKKRTATDERQREAICNKRLKCDVVGKGTLDAHGRGSIPIQERIGFQHSSRDEAAQREHDSMVRTKLNGSDINNRSHLPAKHLTERDIYRSDPATLHDRQSSHMRDGQRERSMEELVGFPEIDERIPTEETHFGGSNDANNMGVQREGNHREGDRDAVNRLRVPETNGLRELFGSDLESAADEDISYMNER